MGKLQRRDRARRRLIGAGLIFAYPAGALAVFTWLCSVGAGGTNYWLFSKLIQTISTSAVISGIFFFLAYRVGREQVRAGKIIAIGDEALRMRQEALARRSYPIVVPQPVAVPDDDVVSYPAPQPIPAHARRVFAPAQATPVSPAPAYAAAGSRYQAKHANDSDGDGALLAMADIAGVTPAVGSVR